MTKPPRKAQSALEYLSIYGIAIFIIIAAAAALYLLGVYSPQNNFIGTCTFSEGFSCSNMKLASTGVLQFNLVNAGQYPIYVSGMGCNTNKSIINVVNTTGTNNNTVYIPSGSSRTFTVQCYRGANQFSEGVGTSFTGYLIVNYTDQYTETKATSLGSLSTKVISGTASSTVFTSSTTSTSTTSTSTTSTSTSTSTTSATTTSTSTTSSTSTSTSTSTTSTVSYVYCIGGYSTGYLNQVYYAPLTTTGVGSWTATTGYPTVIAYQGCAAYNGYVYCAAGCPNNGLCYTTAVYYAQLSSTGVGAWSSGTSYPTGLNEDSCAASNGYIYCVGGEGSSSVNIVYYAQVSSTGVGAWSSASPPSITSTACVTSSGVLYCIAGNNPPGNYLKNTYYAPVSSISSGMSSTSFYPITTGVESCTAYNGYIYCIGGYTSGTGSVTNLAYYAPISSTGIGTWSSTTSYPTSSYEDGSCVSANGYIYCPAGYLSGSVSNLVYYAPISSTGIGNWTATTNYPMSIGAQSCVNT